MVSTLPKGDTQIHCNPYLNPSDDFGRDRKKKKILQFIISLDSKEIKPVNIKGN